MDCSPPGSSVHGILQVRILEWAAMASSRGLNLTQGLNLGLLHCRQILYHLSHQGSYFWQNCGEKRECYYGHISDLCYWLVDLLKTWWHVRPDR